MAIANPSSLRAEQIVDVSSNCYIREGWHENFDTARAAEFLDDAHRFDMAAGDTDHEAKMMAWAHDHGVSLDWLLMGDEKPLLTYRATHAAPPRNVSDPIFAAIAPNQPASGALGKLTLCSKAPKPNARR
jgi:hypothetical protein